MPKCKCNVCGASLKDVMVTNCVLESCSYNINKKCHAISITIGDGDHPACDTFVAGKTKIGITNNMGIVDACKVGKCSYNCSLKCTAKNINVGFHKQHPDCLTFNRG